MNSRKFCALHEAKGAYSDEQMLQDFSGSHKLFFCSSFVSKKEKLHCNV